MDQKRGKLEKGINNYRRDVGTFSKNLGSYPLNSEAGITTDFLSSINWTSLEAEKKSRVEEFLVGPIQEEEIISSVERIKEINLIIRTAVSKEKKERRILEKIEKKEAKIIKMLSISDEAANRCLLGLKETLDWSVAQSIDLSEYLQKGSSGLLAVKNRLLSLNTVKSQELFAIGIVWGKLHGVIEIGYKEDLVCNRIKKRLSGVSKFKKSLEFVHSDLLLLAGLVSQEIEDYNNSLREFYHDVQIEGEGALLKEISWLEEEAMVIASNMKLLLYQFEIPKLIFPSRNYVTFSVSVSEAMAIVQQGFIGGLERRLYNQESLNFCGLDVKTNFTEYYTNGIDPRFCTKDNQVCFLMSLETAIFGKYIRLNELSKSSIKVYDKPVVNYSQLEGGLKDFDELNRLIRRSSERWLKAANDLDSRFRKSWIKRADSIIEKDFMKRWFVDGLHDDCRINNLAYKLLITDYEDEDIIRMTKTDFVSALKKVLNEYHKSLKDVSLFLNNASVIQPLDQVILCGPKSKVLFWEQFFLNVVRPKVYYYDGDDVMKLQDNWNVCMKNRGIGGFKKPVPLYIKVSNTKEFVSVWKG